MDGKGDYHFETIILMTFRGTIGDHILVEFCDKCGVNGIRKILDFANRLVESVVGIV